MSQRYRSVLYANLLSLCQNKKQSMNFYQKTRQIQALNRNVVINQGKSLSEKDNKPTAIEEQLKSYVST